MKILMPDWKNFGKEDIIDAFQAMGHTIMLYAPEPKNYRNDPLFKATIKEYLKKEDFDLLFSSNYFPILSEACEELSLPYISWCYDSPLVLTYSKTIFNKCNHVFLFDSQMVASLQALGVEQVYYMPMAVNPKRLNAMPALSKENKKLLQADVSFVGSLYNEKHTLYDRMVNLDDKTRGYLEGIMAAQRKIYGYSFIESLLTPEIIQKMQEAMPLETHEDGMETLSYLYANYFLCRKMTEKDRIEALQILGEILPQIKTESGRNAYPPKLYTPNQTPFLTGVTNMGTVHYLYEMPYVFRYSKINLNISLRSIQTGIPLRAMDIMGAGGFLLTNFQSDFNNHFIAGEDYVYFEDFQDMMNKIDYYLSHEEERKTIAENGHKKTCEEHSYEKHLAEMLAIAGL